jgi:hypothetical protein
MIKKYSFIYRFKKKKGGEEGAIFCDTVKVERLSFFFTWLESAQGR